MKMNQSQVQEQPPKGGATELITNIHAELTKLLQAVTGSNLPPQIAEGLSGVLENYKQVIQQLSQAASGNGTPQQPAQEGQASVTSQPPQNKPVPMNNRGAIPASSMQR